jgi:parallel beta-helix repeat protein
MRTISSILAITMIGIFYPVTGYVLPGADGGHVLLDAGVYTYNECMFIPYQNFVLEGRGKGVTILQFNVPYVEHGVNCTNPGGHVTIKNLTIERTNFNHNNPGFGLQMYGPNFSIENVAVGGYNHGIHFQPNNWLGRITGCDVHGNFQGIVFEGGAPNNLTLKECNIGLNAGYGIWFQSTPGVPISKPLSALICNNSIEVNGWSGIRVDACQGITIANNYFESNEWQLPASNDTVYQADCDIFIHETPPASIMSITIKDNYFGDWNCGNVMTSYGVTTSTTKYLAYTTYSFLRPWRFSLGMPYKTTFTGTGTTLIHSGNYYLKLKSSPTGPNDLDWGDSKICTVTATGF